MIVRLEENSMQKDIEVVIKYQQMNQTIKRIETIVKSVDKTVKCNTDKGQIWVNASDIYYIESIDKSTFIYTEKSVCSTEMHLYELVDELMNVGFVRVSKSCIININMLDCIRPLLNSRMEATLVNGERINITRKFIPAIKEKLQER